MKMVRIYFMLAVVCFLSAAALVVLAPPTAVAGDDPCNRSCYWIVVCEIGSCTSCPTHPCRPTVLYYAWNTLECEPPYNCASVIIGCTACQA
jgi:hypothetical protein